MVNKRGKKAQMKLSFGMIFSIFLIIIFIVFAFWGIGKFLNLQKNVQVQKFAQDLQSDVSTMWASSSSSSEEEYSLPSKIEAVCFRDDELKNLFFQSSKLIESKNIEHLDISKIISEENPYCIENSNGKIKLIISKEFGENLVTISRQ